MRTLCFVALLAVSGISDAQINKCSTPGGKTVYQQAPCNGESKQTGSVETSNAYLDPAVQARDAEQEKRHVPAANAMRKRMGEEAQAQEAALQEQGRGFERMAAAGRGQVMIGQSESQVRQAWGTPSSVNRTVTSSSVSEQWVYSIPKGKSRYVYLTGGTVTALQE